MAAQRGQVMRIVIRKKSSRPIMDLHVPAANRAAHISAANAADLRHIGDAIWTTRGE
jgi:hypothetical protein